MHDTIVSNRLQNIIAATAIPPIAHELESPLLFTKLTVPDCTPTLLSRPRLIEQLDRWHGGAVSLLSAPAGFGKTTLIADWARRCGNPVAWLTIDEHDNDPVLFWRYLIAALQTVNPQLGQRSQAVLATQLGTPLETVVTLLVNDIIRLVEPDRPLILVLDNYYWIRNTSIHKTVNYLLQHQPKQLHILLLTRADPLLPLARLRVEGRLQELRMADMRLTPSETVALLSLVVAYEIPPSAVEVLVQLTDGWAAAIQLVGLSLRQTQAGSAERLVKVLPGAKQHVFAFLIEEVLNHQGEDVRQFLQKTAVLSQFCAPLCTAVTDLPNADGLLRQLVEKNLFISPLDDEGRWFHYNPLFAELLQSSLDEETRRECHRRAARWYAENQLIQDAMRSAQAAADYELMAAVLTQTYKRILAQGLLVSLQKWLAVLPEAYRSPRIRLMLAWCRVYESSEQEVEEIVAAIAAAMPEIDSPFQGEILAVRAVYASLYGQSEQAMALATQATALIDPDDHLSFAAAYQALGNARHNLGELESAIVAYKNAVKHFEPMGNVFMAQVPMYRIADIQRQQGRLHQALQTYEDVRQQAQAAGHEPAIVSGQIFGHLSELYREWNDLDQAVAYAQQELELARLGHMRFAEVNSYLELAAAWAAMQDMAAAREVLDRAREAAELLRSIPVCAHVAMQEARHELLWGDVGVADEWAEQYAAGRAAGEVSLTPLHAHTADVLLARVRLRQGRSAEALSLLRETAAHCERSGRVQLLTEIHILEAIAQLDENHSAEAQHAIVCALTLARPEGYVRVFIDNGPRLAPLLLSARHLFPDYVDRLLKLLPTAATKDGQSRDSGLLDQLTDRELEILRLIGQGWTNRQIADSLFITVGTVKGHTNHIFSKLDVQNRTQALVRARELGLLNS